MSGKKELSDADYLRLAEEVHNISYEVEKEDGLYPHRDFISFYGMALDYQKMLISIMRKLDERGWINHE